MDTFTVMVMIMVTEYVFKYVQGQGDSHGHGCGHQTVFKIRSRSWSLNQPSESGCSHGHGHGDRHGLRHLSPECAHTWSTNVHRALAIPYKYSLLVHGIPYVHVIRWESCKTRVPKWEWYKYLCRVSSVPISASTLNLYEHAKSHLESYIEQ